MRKLHKSDFKTKNPARNLPIFLLLLFCCVQPQLCNMASNQVELSEKFAKNLGEFSMDMYSNLLDNNGDKNIIFSPISIQTCVAMARVGAEGETAKELDRGLRLVSDDVNAIADSFSGFLEEAQNSSVLKVANKIYVSKDFTIQKDYNELLTKKFYSDAESINFEQNVAAAESMNNWVELKTNNLIKDLISPDAIDKSTALVLLNAIHFKGQWVHKFPEGATRPDDFYLDETRSVKVPMMNIKNSFRYADLPELDATALEMPYKDTDLSMLVILPNSRTGLRSLEQKLRGIALTDITKKMFSHQVIVKFPKFKAEFSVELNDQLKKMGMSRMFSGDAEFGKMLETSQRLVVSKVIHKAFIEVNEEGTEAAAATGMTLLTCSFAFFDRPKEFKADKSFFYAIKTYKNDVLFVGQFRNA